MDDRAAPSVRRDDGVADPNIFDPERTGIDHDGALGTTDTDDLERKARDDRLVIGHSESEPADDAVGIRLRGDGPAGHRSGPEIRLALHQRSVTFQERRRIAPCLADRSEAKRIGRSRFLFSAGGKRQHRRDRRDRFGEVAVAGRQLRQRVRQSWRQAGHLACDLARGKPIRSSEDNVDADNTRVPLGNTADEFGHQVAWPRPLPVFGEAPLVDVDNRHSCRILGARPEPLNQVEATDAQFGDEARVNNPQHQSASDQHERGRAAGTSQQRDAPGHAKSQLQF